MLYAITAITSVRGIIVWRFDRSSRSGRHQRTTASFIIFTFVNTIVVILILEQFTAIGPPSFIWRGGGEGQKKIVVEHFPEASAGGLFVRRFRRRFLPEEFSSAGDLLWRPTLPKRIRIRIRILIYRFLKYWGSLISDENSSGRSLWKVFHNFLRIIFAQKCSTIF